MPQPQKPRLLSAPTPYARAKAPDVVHSFHKACEPHGILQSLPSDNGAVFTGAGRRGKVLLEAELERLL